ncbi:hypothetical protein INS49_002708 [Diaporthe citri]|uniref:uncharacterized protein n=1 Tax=Diaporthe citri TaxID=83186 RepID=UPI001C7E6F40|nr:uncharacterized protein INS49_002708 [Diaporthe citri]KAG6368499.1 hypothetical protein INS49_002708 [Diaporthe citri]
MRRIYLMSESTPAIFAPVFNVDYGDIGALTSFMEEQNVHTVISAFGITATSLATSQLNLIKAADASSATERFIPSSFAIPYPEDGVTILPPLEHYFISLKALEATSLDVIVVDREHNAAGIPGDGDEPVTLTYTFAVARFVVAAPDLEAWPRELRVVGDELTFNELVAIAEEVKGAKFEVAYDSVEKLKSSQITELPGHAASYDKFPKERLQWFLAIFELWMATGRGRVPCLAILLTCVYT